MLRKSLVGKHQLLISEEVVGYIVRRMHFLCQAQPSRLKLIFLLCLLREERVTPVTNKESELQWGGLLHSSVCSLFFVVGFSFLCKDWTVVCLLMFSLPLTSLAKSSHCVKALQGNQVKLLVFLLCTWFHHRDEDMGKTERTIELYKQRQC